MNDKVVIIDKDSYQTPQILFDELDKIYGFEYDLCASKVNTKCDKFFTLENSILNQTKIDGVCFCNPPYSRGNISNIVAHLALLAENKRFFCLALLPVDTSTAWFHKYIYNRFFYVFVKGRIKFDGGDQSARFANMFVLFQAGHPDAHKLAKLQHISIKK
jgi:phage N-6-adenine-methyltransferase